MNRVAMNRWVMVLLLHPSGRTRAHTHHDRPAFNILRYETAPDDVLALLRGGAQWTLMVGEAYDVNVPQVTKFVADMSHSLMDVHAMSDDRTREAPSGGVLAQAKRDDGTLFPHGVPLEPEDYASGLVLLLRTGELVEELNRIAVGRVVGAGAASAASKPNSAQVILGIHQLLQGSTPQDARSLRRLARLVDDSFTFVRSVFATQKDGTGRLEL